MNDKAKKARGEPQALCDMSVDGLEELMREIKSQGIDEKTAWHYAALIGDTPITDKAGNCIIVMDGTKEIARLKPLKFFDLE